MKHKIEIFSAGWHACTETIEAVKKLIIAEAGGALGNRPDAPRIDIKGHLGGTADNRTK